MEEDERKISEWLQFQKELSQEKDFLTSLLSKIDKQIHALQVEQLHLLSTINLKGNLIANCTSSGVTSLPSTSNSTETVDVKPKPLDLSIPIEMEYIEEEESEEIEDSDISEENSPSESDEEWK